MMGPKLVKHCEKCGKWLVSGVYIWYPYLPVIKSYKHTSYRYITPDGWKYKTYCESCASKYDKGDKNE